ncbi:alkanesulfonate monooxygenase SsuD/methylene tetrahydromethanopterin reductase-like flavin-dependent oxidoreductase (luciferase family) [Actinocorallia herbida]|uniref:Alkanesulfonate monooxygenase SsuD/methylene tetrahydromethanopterin reductase-like flavin-dependent oxidoreductase (Luciferase family) n=1 Tax=Actinocorallia herbida TaxID=58109 RepID=A0A3N1D975_9ACTN|nr:LLM class flavin-dependent oxidoreductase [Actinocorallia herbida]ROO90019.1 alkanesulfonate monooxygenase SsuD/methylene tetrahydromethanopterin reductase-like flavin-dependent oxidoreductase (luciferase family) [Actinocorallia herbida]
MELGILSLGDHLPDPRTGERVSQAARHQAIVEAGVRAEELGFTMYAIGEHHFNDYIVSSPSVMLAAVAARTGRIRLAPAVTLLPMADPVRVAEDFATLDLISGGRMEMVVGRGISTKDYRAFGYDPAEDRDNLDEKLALLKALWSADAQPVTWSGRFRSPLKNVTVQPRPLQAEPRIWMGSGLSEGSIRRAAEQGHPLFLPSILLAPEAYAEPVRLYREVMEEHGFGERAFVGCCSYVHVQERSQDAKDTWEPYLVQYVEWVNALTGRQMKADYASLIDGPAICGSPAEVSDRLQAVEELLRPDVHLSVFDPGGLPAEDVLATMELFASDVMPKLHG